MPLICPNCHHRDFTGVAKGLLQCINCNSTFSFTQLQFKATQKDNPVSDCSSQKYTIACGDDLSVTWNHNTYRGRKLSYPNQIFRKKNVSVAESPPAAAKTAPPVHERKEREKSKHLKKLRLSVSLISGIVATVLVFGILCCIPGGISAGLTLLNVLFDGGVGFPNRLAAGEILFSVLIVPFAASLIYALRQGKTFSSWYSYVTPTLIGIVTSLAMLIIFFIVNLILFSVLQTRIIYSLTGLFCVVTLILCGYLTMYLLYHEKKKNALLKKNVP